MRAVPLGASPVRVTALGFGAAGIGNLYRAVDDETARRAVDAAWQAGIRYFDTAPHYGLGLSERRLGAALAGRPRAEFTVSTKVGRVLVPTPETAHLTDLAAGFDVPATWPETLVQKWRIDVGTGYASPLIVGDRVYVFSRRGDNEGMSAHEIASGKELWRAGYEAPFLTVEQGVTRYVDQRLARV